MVWLTRQALHTDELRRAAEADAALEQRVSLALWRMDTELAPIIAAEVIRAPSHVSGRVFRRSGGQLFAAAGSRAADAEPAGWQMGLRSRMRACRRRRRCSSSRRRTWCATSRPRSMAAGVRPKLPKRSCNRWPPRTEFHRKPSPNEPPHLQELATAVDVAQAGRRIAQSPRYRRLPTSATTTRRSQRRIRRRDSMS